MKRGLLVSVSKTIWKKKKKIRGHACIVRGIDVKDV